MTVTVTCRSACRWEVEVGGAYVGCGNTVHAAKRLAERHVGCALVWPNRASGPVIRGRAA